MRLTRFKISIRVNSPTIRQRVIEMLRSDALYQFSANLSEVDGDGLAECWLSLPHGLTAESVERRVREAISIAALRYVP